MLRCYIDNVTAFEGGDEDNAADQYKLAETNKLLGKIGDTNKCLAAHIM